MSTWDDAVPCADDPDAWFGYENGHHGKRTVEERRGIERAKRLCARECPLAQRRQCAKEALDSGAEYGIWAGVELMLHKSLARERHAKLAVAREQLRRIAYGSSGVAVSA